MHGERPLLTIAVPTYNRHGCLEELLTVLTPQLANETRVELVISDNASQDDTPRVVESFQQRGLVLTYLRNETNIGPDANFIRCYQAARGEYVWIFGDDDILVPGGLHVLLGHLETRKYDLLYLRTSTFRDRYREKEILPFSGSIKAFVSPRDFALYACTSLTFITANISRKAAFRDLPIQEFNKLIGSNLGQLAWTFSLLRGNPQCACVLDELVAARVDNSGGIGTCEVFGTTLKAIVNEYFGVQSPIGRAILNRTIQVFFPGAMLYSRTIGRERYIAEDATGILEGLYRTNPRYWLFTYPVLRLPIPLAKIWVLTSKVINRMDGLLGYPISR
jgi:glycosyltransferase involved in cell wall biosynthesis